MSLYVCYLSQLKKRLRGGRLAQLLEHGANNTKVAGLVPTWATVSYAFLKTKTKKTKQANTKKKKIEKKV